MEMTLAIDSHRAPHPTTASRAVNKFFLVLVTTATTAAIPVNTSDYADGANLLEKLDRGSSYRQPQAPQLMKQIGLSAESNLAHIKSVIQPTVTELAIAMNVSRQSIYDWQSGSKITSENFEKLTELSLAADEFANVERQVVHSLLRRRIAGRNFFARVQGGESAIDVAKKLIEIAGIELQQRVAVSEQLKSRSKRNSILDVPGLHYPNENG